MPNITLVTMKVYDIKTPFPPPSTTYRTALHLSHRAAVVHLREKGGDGGFLGRGVLGADDMAVPHNWPHHDPGHVWLLSGHL